MRRPGLPLVAALGVLSAVVPSACVVPECAQPDYSLAECRVIAENELARLRSSHEIELRFQDPDAADSTSWDARGLLSETQEAGIVARVAGPGPFAISVQRRGDALTSVSLRLDNVDVDASVVVETPDGATEVATGTTASSREVTIPLDDEVPRWIRGTRPCPPRYRIAVTSDIQTNPTQLARIVERLQLEHDRAEEADEPLVALLVPGDITESTRDEELETVTDTLARLPFPVMVTPGNHDVYRPSRPYYNLTFGPGNHVATVCGTKVVMLDTGSGAIATSVEARLPELLDRGDAEVLLVAMHHPVYPGQTGAGWSREDQAAHVLAELALAEADLVLAGHVHALRDFPAIEVGDTTLREIIVGTAGALQGLGEPRFGYLRLTIEGTTVEPCFVEVPPPGYDGPTGQGLPQLPYCPR